MGDILYITMHNNPDKENKCIVTKIIGPNDGNAVAFHFTYSVFFSEFSFQYEAKMLHETNEILLTHSTVITGVVSGVLGYAVSTMVKEGCDHMSVSVPALARVMKGEHCVVNDK
jgi:hypothetical protein